MGEVTIQEALKLGVEAHRVGNAQEADRYYTAVLRSRPNHPEGNHNMGVLAVSLKKPEQALPYFKKALEFNPSVSQFWLSLLEALFLLGKLDEARDLLLEAHKQGLRGEAFELFNAKLNLDEGGGNSQEPPQDVKQPLVVLYEKKQFESIQSKS